MQGMKLSNETEFAEVKGHWLKTYNIAYVVIFAIFFLLAVSKGSGVGRAIFGSLGVCVGAFLVKQKAAQMKRYGIAESTFALGNELTTEEIGEKVAIFLLNKGIETTFSDGKLIFKGKNAGYTFIRYENRECFSLSWDYSLGKIFSPGRWQFITDYRELLEETGMIAYYIQQLKVDA